MTKTKIIKPSADVMATMMQREKITVTGAYETVKLNTSSMDDTYAHVL